MKKLSICSQEYQGAMYESQQYSKTVNKKLVQHSLWNMGLVSGVGMLEEGVAPCSLGISFLKAKATFLFQIISNPIAYQKRRKRLKSK